jgi:hypothetical protein
MIVNAILLPYTKKKVFLNIKKNKSKNQKINHQKKVTIIQSNNLNLLMQINLIIMLLALKNNLHSNIKVKYVFNIFR